MPKINVYVSDELSDAIKDAGVPVSPVCQRALEQAVSQIATVRAVAAADLDAGDPAAGLVRFTARAQKVVALAAEQARARATPGVATTDLLGGILAEGSNLAIRVLRAVEVDLDQLRVELRRAGGGEPTAGSEARRLTAAAAAALEAAVTESISLGHNFVGCEHLLLGLTADPDGEAGALLRAQGAEHRTVRRAVVAALAGYSHLREQGQSQPAATSVEALVGDAVRRQLAPVVERLAVLEDRVGSAG
ncbi:Clp protease N-terminal domain-containing protein [Pseudonocardia sp. GCM10023141]|uniref:Clp protease N-terminal domain-containing protein n=1 Tax=Pseudonocardia sp. GCM10023141 TaxID=3252653 RepID=UPI00360E1FE0